MSHRFASIVTAAVALTMLMLGCVAGLALHLELGAGPSQDVFSAAAYNRLFTAHGAVLVFGVLRPGLLASIITFHVARWREADGLAPGSGGWLAGLGALATVGVAILVGVLVARSTDLVFAQTCSRWIVRLSGIADLGLGLGVVVGMTGVDRSRSSLMNWTVVAVASGQALLGSIEVVTSKGLDGDTFGAFVVLQMALLVGLGVVAVSESPRSPVPIRARLAVTTLVLAAVSDAIISRLWGEGPEWRGWAFAPLLAAGQLIAVGALIRSLGRGGRSDSPAWDVVAVLAAVLVPSLLVRLYLASLSVDVHLADTYFVVGDFHLLALLGPAIGGPLALRHFAPQRYAGTRAWLQRASPWLIGIALIGYAFSLLKLGYGGMPRRYYAYLPEYLAGHRIAAVAAMLLCVGMLVEAGLWIRSAQSRT